jgi:metal-responsive CopG/Arc/MetJ family transcriptional regulator
MDLTAFSNDLKQSADPIVGVSLSLSKDRLNWLDNKAKEYGVKRSEVVKILIDQMRRAEQPLPA